MNAFYEIVYIRTIFLILTIWQKIISKNKIFVTVPIFPFSEECEGKNG